MRKVKETVSYEVVRVIIFNLEKRKLSKEIPYCILLLMTELQPMGRSYKVKQIPARFN